LHPDEGPLRECTNNPPLHKPSTQNLPTIAKDLERPTFGDNPEVQLHQPAHISTIAAGPNQNGSAASSTQIGRGAPHQSPREHLHQYTWLKETQSLIKSKSMTGMKKPR
jgi:hypothetical protein